MPVTTQNKKKKPTKKKKLTPLEKAQQQVAEHLEGRQRAVAELANFKRQQAATMTDQRSRALGAAAQSLLPLADNFHAVLEHVPEDLAKNPWVTGVLHVAKQLDTVLESMGVQQMTVIGELFDPARHEALAEEEREGAPPGTILEVAQEGYELGELVLRPAKVTIAT